MAAPEDAAGLLERQQALVLALAGRAGAAADPPGLAPLPGIEGAEGGLARGFQAYRVNAQALSAKALGGVFVRLRDALGAEDFEPMAWAFWRWAPPQQGDLACWGGRLAEFLAAQQGMDPALCDLPRLEWAMHEAERAADAGLDADSLQLLGQREAGSLGLRMRPGVALLQQSTGRAALVWRQGWRACSRELGAGESAFMQALLAGVDLASALDAALAADTEFDFTAWLQLALRDGLLQAAVDLNLIDERQEP